MKPNFITLNDENTLGAIQIGESYNVPVVVLTDPMLIGDEQYVDLAISTVSMSEVCESLDSTLCFDCDGSSTYEKSFVKGWLNSDFYEALPDEIKESMIEIEYESNGKILSDKVVLMSIHEMGFDNEEIIRKEGLMYKNSGDFLLSNLEPATYMTRTRVSMLDPFVWAADEDMELVKVDIEESAAMIAVIRVKL